MKILHTIRQGKIGGGESHVLDLVKHLDSVYQSEVVSFTDGEMVNILKELKIPVHVIHTEKPFDSNILKELNLLIKKVKPDIIHAHGTRACSNSYKIAKKNKIPLIYTVHGWSFHKGENMISYCIRILSEMYLTKVSNLVINVSNANYLQGKKLFNLKNSIVVKNSVNLEKFDVNKKYKGIKQELGIKKNEILVSFIARFTFQKDPFTLINAIKKQKQQNVKFLFVGDGELKNEAIQLVKKFNLENRVIFLPFRQDIPNILSDTNIYCLPSLWEGLPIGILEAMAMKKTVITTPVDGNVELIIDAVSGILFKQKNSTELAKKLDELVVNMPLRTNLSTKAYNFILKNHQIPTMINQIESVYKMAIKKFI